MLQDAEILIYMGKEAGLYGSAVFKTTQLAKALHSSQQSASRKLQELENKNLITKKPAKTGFEIILTEKGKNYLGRLKSSLDIIFEGKQNIKGKVITGLGEGKFYTNKPNYKEQFVERTGITPHPGTLNLEVDPREAAEFLADKNEIPIEGFSTSERTYGELKAYTVNINEHKAAIILPARSSHPRNTIEIIADFSIREKLNLKDGDEVTIK